MPRRAASRQSTAPSATVAAPSSPEGQTWLWQSTKPRAHADNGTRSRTLYSLCR